MSPLLTAEQGPTFARGAVHPALGVWELGSVVGGGSMPEGLAPRGSDALQVPGLAAPAIRRTIAAWINGKAILAF